MNLTKYAYVQGVVKNSKIVLSIKTEIHNKQNLYSYLEFFFLNKCGISIVLSIILLNELFQ